MNELVKNLISQANIDEATAEKVILIVKGFLEDKLSGPVGKKVADVLDGVDAKDVKDILGKAKGLFG